MIDPSPLKLPQRQYTITLTGMLLAQNDRLHQR